MLLDSEVKETEEPDRVYGLKASGAFRSILDTDSKVYPVSTGYMFQNARICPFKKSDDPVILPFLVHEAKSRKSADSFDSIEIQIALPIWRLLKLHLDVQDGLPSSKRTAPLAWFFSNKGEKWVVSGCYTETQGLQTVYVSDAILYLESPYSKDYLLL